MGDEDRHVTAQTAEEAATGSGSDSDDDLSHLLRFESEEAFFAAASANAACYFKAERHIVLEEPDLLQKDATVFSFRQRGETTEHLADNTGGAIYDAAILLGRHLARSEAAALKGARVLELGSGPALAAAVAARLVGETGRVLATDGETSSVELARTNLAALGNPPDRVSAARFWWGTPLDEVPELRGRAWDFVLATDVAYTDEILDPLVDALCAVCGPGTTALLCNGSRSWRRERRLRAALRKHFDVAELERSRRAGAGGESRPKTSRMSRRRSGSRRRAARPAARAKRGRRASHGGRCTATCFCGVSRSRRSSAAPHGTRPGACEVLRTQVRARPGRR